MADTIEEVRSDLIAIRFEARKCVHSRNCVLGRPDVFVPNVDGEWIHPDVTSPEEIAALAANCPSGAITYERLDGGPNETPPIVNVVRIRENGPLAVHAPLTIGGVDSGLRATLCRCGASKSKPLCDGSHAAIGFLATGEPLTTELSPLVKRNGPLSVTPLKNGPLKSEGPLEVVTGTGRTIMCTTETYLCRCGASGNKPFCDGGHARIGFTTE